jgi:hypothetical protein
LDEPHESVDEGSGGADLHCEGKAASATVDRPDRVASHAGDRAEHHVSPGEVEAVTPPLGEGQQSAAVGFGKIESTGERAPDCGRSQGVPGSIASVSIATDPDGLLAELVGVIEGTPENSDEGQDGQGPGFARVVSAIACQAQGSLCEATGFGVLAAIAKRPRHTECGSGRHVLVTTALGRDQRPAMDGV